MRKFIAITIASSLSTVMLLAQTQSPPITPPAVKDFSGNLTFLSSDWMEGREIGTRGCFMAADFIATMMELNGLKPFGDPYLSDKPGGEMTFHQRYFQNFDVIRYQAEKATLTFIRRLTDSESALQLSPGVDFIWKSVPNNIEAEAAMAFAGYGLDAPEKGYSDYSGIDVNGRIVVVLDGYP